MNKRTLSYELSLKLAELNHLIGEQEDIIARAATERERLQALRLVIETAVTKLGPSGTSLVAVATKTPPPPNRYGINS